MSHVTPTKLPQATVDRWRTIVLKAAKSGTDISQLVQHFAEQSFQNKVVLLENQGAHRRALTNMRQVVLREVERAEAASRGPTQKSGALLRSYEASRYDFRPPSAGEGAGQPSGRKVSIKDVPMGFSGSEHGCTIVPLKPALTTSEQLRAYVAGLHQQLAKIDQDIAGIDAVLNQGMRNHKAVVDDLAATSRELYRLAQEIIADLPAAAAPAPVFVPPEPMAGEATQTYVDAAPATPPAAGAPKAPASPAARASQAGEAVRETVLNLWSKVTEKVGKK